MLNCSRQAGKSTTTALMATHTALYVPGSLTLLLSPSLRQSQELFKKVAFYRALGRPVAPEAESALRLELETGSRVIALPGAESTIRGYSGVSLLIIDEASRLEDDIYRAMRPSLAVSGGRLVLSSPFGRRGFFYEQWVNGGAAWERIEVPATACPRIPAAFLAEEQRALGPWFAQEYLCQFLDTQFQLYSMADIEAAVRSDVQPLFGGI